MKPVVVAVEASAPKVYPRVTLSSASTLSGSVVRTLRGGEGLPTMFGLVLSNRGVRLFAAPLSKGETGGLWRALLVSTLFPLNERVHVCDCYDNCSNRCG